MRTRSIIVTASRIGRLVELRTIILRRLAFASSSIVVQSCRRRPPRVATGLIHSSVQLVSCFDSLG